MKTKLFITTLLVILFAVAITGWPKQPKYVYAVRENVNPAGSTISWDLWCWHEYANGHIKKTFVESYKAYGSAANPDRVETTKCK